MEREECEKQIRDLMIQIYDVYRKYNPSGNYLAMFIIDGILTMNNAFYADDADHPLNMSYDIEPREK